AIARLITLAERSANGELSESVDVLGALAERYPEKEGVPVLGITGTGGAGKSSLTDELVRRFLEDFTEKKVAVLSVDPSKQRTGGALLGDRIRMNAVHHPRVYMRSLATRRNRSELSAGIREAISIVKRAGYDFIIVETSGIGQGDAAVVEVSDLSLYVMTAEFGAPTQLEKIEMLDFADLVAINKFDRKGSEDALRDVRKQYKRNHQLFDVPDEQLPIYGTMANRFHYPGVNRLYRALIDKVNEKLGLGWESSMPEETRSPGTIHHIIPPERSHYLREIAQTVREYRREAEEQARVARRLYQLKGAREALGDSAPKEALESLDREIQRSEAELHPENQKILEEWPRLKER